MDFQLTTEQKDLQRAARKFADGEFDRELAMQLEREHRFPREIVKKACALGFVGLHFPEELGGQGYGLLERALVSEQFCRRDSGIGLCLDTASFSSELLIRFGSDALKSAWIPRIVSGECMSAGGFTEPNHGSDITRLDTTARRDGDDYVINGGKIFITNGTICDYVTVLLMTDPEADPPRTGMSTVLVETDRPGFVAEDVGEKMGQKMTATAQISLTDVRVPVSNLIGEENRGFYQVLEFFEESRAGIAAQALGIAQGAFDRAVTWIKKREQYGQRIADFQVTQHKIADMATKLETSRLITYEAAWALDNGRRGSGLSSMAKNVASRTAVEICDEAIQLMGGYGYLTDNEVERFYRDARIFEIWEGTKEIQKNIIARAVLGK